MNNTSQSTKKQKSDPDNQNSRDFINTLFDGDENIMVITVKGAGDEDLRINVGDILIVNRRAAPKAGDVCIYKLEADDLYGFDYFEDEDEQKYEVFGVIYYHIRRVDSHSVLDAEVIV